MAHWSEEAACRGKDPAIFFPGEGQKGGHVTYTPARTVCSACEVSDDCLAFALSFETNGHRLGMWGGLSPKERDRLGYRIRYCPIDGTRIHTRDRYCSDECRAVARKETSARNYQSRVA